MTTVSESVCCQEIPEEEGKLRELDVQSTASQIMRGSDQFSRTDGCCKQSHRKSTNSIAKIVEPMNRPAHNFVVFTLLTRVCVDFIYISSLSYTDTMLHHSYIP